MISANLCAAGVFFANSPCMYVYAIVIVNVNLDVKENFCLCVVCRRMLLSAYNSDASVCIYIYIYIHIYACTWVMYVCIHAHDCRLV